MDQLMNATVNGIPLVVVVLGLVTLSARLGAEGKLQLAISMLLGLLLGVAYMATQVSFDTYSNVFGAVVFGLLLGLVASGIYDTGVKLSERAGKVMAASLPRE